MSIWLFLSYLLLRGYEVKRSMVDIGSGLNIYSCKFLQYFESRGVTLPPMDEPNLHIRGFDNVSKRFLRIISLLVQLDPKIV